jgi:O-antigen/teichoic acid export membrane protein
MNFSVFSRKLLNTTFSKNLAALGFGFISQLIIQVASVPMFLTHANLDQYAVWLVSYNLAQFSGLLDFGSIAYSQNRWHYLNAQNKGVQIDDSLKQITNLMIFGNLLFIVGLFFITYSGIAKLDMLLISVFILSNLLHSFLGLFEARTKVDSKVALGLQVSNLFRIIEFFGTMIGLVFFSHSLLTVAMLALLFKTSMFLLMISRLPRKYKFFGWGVFKWRQLFEILRTGNPFLVAKLADLIMLSGLVIVLKDRISSTELILFIAARTFFRLWLQLTGLVAHSYGYEMSTTWVAHDLRGMQSLIRTSAKVNMFLSTSGVILYLLLGNQIFDLWVQSKLELNSEIVIWGVVYSFILSINQNLRTKFNAINNNFSVSFVQMFYSIILILLVQFFGFSLSPARIFLLLSVIELFFYLTVTIAFRRSIENYFKESINE